MVLHLSKYSSRLRYLRGNLPRRHSALTDVFKRSPRSFDPLLKCLPLLGMDISFYWASVQGSSSSLTLITQTRSDLNRSLPIFSPIPLTSTYSISPILDQAYGSDILYPVFLEMVALTEDISHSFSQTLVLHLFPYHANWKRPWTHTQAYQGKIPMILIDTAPPD